MAQVIFPIVLLALVFSFVVLEVRTLRRWEGWWRIVAALPGLALIVIILLIVIGISLDKTAHNLWPFEIVMWSAGGLVFLGLVHLLRKITKA